MVQVDVFWSYGIGAGFAYAAQKQLADKPPTRENGGLLANPYFARNLLYLACFFGPSGIYLLWQFTSWETMHALDKTMPAWLVTTFAITNVTQGLLGFWVTYRLAQARRRYLAFLQPLIGYFMMFFVLVHGWDGKGYQRFFSQSREEFLAWTPASVVDWLVSPVALTLLAMGVVLIPVMVGWMARWLVEGQRLLRAERIEATMQAGEGERRSRSVPSRRYSTVQLAAIMLTLIFGVVLGTAILASVLVHQLGWALGLIAFGVLGTLAIFGKTGLLHALWRRLDPLRDLALAAGPSTARTAQSRAA
ncbi:MAG: hypothetical protein OEZ06_04325 [Myxococcales bacterium]|nr:hypothetical protein [Myxococcales bacterium]